MAYYVYILQSDLDQTYYKGFSENPIRRLSEHNDEKVTSTSLKTPWKFVAIFEFETKRETLISEKKFKKYGTTSLLKLINSDSNKIEKYLHSIINLPHDDNSSSNGSSVG